MNNYILQLSALGLLLASCQGGGQSTTGTNRAGNEGAESSNRSECGQDKPVCEPGCSGDNQACVYTGNGCECVSACSEDPKKRVCAGDGPNQGCDTGYACGANCECVAADTCLADAPVCAGDGPNSGCDADYACNAQCACEPYEPGALSTRTSRSTTIDLSADDELLAMVNSNEGSVSFISAEPGAEKRLALVASSAESGDSKPMSVVFHPDQTRAFVANRGTGTVSRIADVQSYPHLDAEVYFGGEPVGLALDPKGKTLWITNWVSGKVHVIDTDSMKLLHDIEVGGNPWAIAITNDGDADADDEKVLVTQFFGRARQGVQSEGTDDGREGIVQVMNTSDPAYVREITLAPLEKCFESADLTSGCFPNQLLGINVHRAFGKTHAYVISAAASPRGPVQFNHNVQALVSVIDLDQERELTELTTNLNTGVAAQKDDDGNEALGRRFMNQPNAIDFVNRDDAAVGYVSSAGSDIVLRVEFTESGEVKVGAPSAFNIPAGQNPSGLVVTHRREKAGAFVSNLISRDVSVLSFADQNKVKDVLSTDIPLAGTPEFDIWKGERFFNTSTGIWSKEGWGSCQGCHPMGLTDSVTWQFAAGPRQTIALDGQYDSNDPTNMRALNWTAIFDETDDFENNTRGTSGGSGAIRNDDGPIVSAPPAAAFAAVVMEDGYTTENHQNLNGSMKFLSRNAEVCTNEDTCPNWDQIDKYIQSLKSTRGYAPYGASLEHGRYVFEDAGCQKCHGGPKWTISQTFYTPELSSGELGDRLFESNRALVTPLDASPLQTIGLSFDSNVDATLLAGDDSDGGTPALNRQACNVRNVGTFAAAGGAEELRANQTPAQGRNGFNPPSLLSIATGAPYFHNGAAEKLEEIFDERFAAHLTSGNVNFKPTEQDRSDLLAFLKSIDEATAPFDVIPASIICPLDFSQPAPWYPEEEY